MRKTIRVLLAVSLVLGAGLFRPAAAEVKPAIVAAVASYNELLEDVGFLGKLADRPDLGSAMEGAIALATHGRGLAGIDKSRPLGVVFQIDGEDVSYYGFVPVTDLKAVLGVVEAFADVAPAGALYKIVLKDGTKTWYVKGQDGWAFIGESPEDLAHCDANPLALLSGMEKHYLLSGRMFVANFPAKIFEKIIADRKKDSERDWKRTPDVSDAEYAAAMKLNDNMIRLEVEPMADLDQVTLGWGLDRSSGKTFIDSSVTARPGTPTAAAFVDEVKTQFAGFRMPGASLTFNFAWTIPAKNIE